MINAHKIDIHQHAVPNPMERIGKFSPRRMITSSAIALSQLNASFKIADQNVGSGTKNANVWRITSMAKSEMINPAHVARKLWRARTAGRL